MWVSCRQSALGLDRPQNPQTIRQKYIRIATTNSKMWVVFVKRQNGNSSAAQ